MGKFIVLFGRNCLLILNLHVQDARRKFIWEEMSYLERWWRDASDSKRESFTKLVKNGQLEIVGGGWVMNDEVYCLYICKRLHIYDEKMKKCQFDCTIGTSY